MLYVLFCFVCPAQRSSVLFYCWPLTSTVHCADAALCSLHSHFAVGLKGLVAPLIHKYRYCAQEQRDKCTFPVCVTVSGLIDTRELEDAGEGEGRGT